MTKGMTKLEKSIVVIFYYESYSMPETAYILDVPEIVVQHILAAVTKRLMKHD